MCALIIIIFFVRQGWSEILILTIVQYFFLNTCSLPFICDGRKN